MVLSVGPGVLIPRPETELIIDFVLEAAAANPALARGQWADLGMFLQSVMLTARDYGLDTAELLVLPDRDLNAIVGLKRGAYAKRGPGFTDTAVALRCVRPDETSAVVRVHYMGDGGARVGVTVGRAEYFVPAGVVLRALTAAEIFSGVAFAIGFCATTATGACSQRPTQGAGITRTFTPSDVFSLPSSDCAPANSQDNESQTRTVSAGGGASASLTTSKW